MFIGVGLFIRQTNSGETPNCDMVRSNYQLTIRAINSIKENQELLIDWSIVDGHPLHQLANTWKCSCDHVNALNDAKCTKCSADQPSSPPSSPPTSPIDPALSELIEAMKLSDEVEKKIINDWKDNDTVDFARNHILNAVQVSQIKFELFKEGDGGKVLRLPEANIHELITPTEKARLDEYLTDFDALINSRTKDSDTNSNNIFT